VSPVPKALVIMTVLSISPTTIKVVCARRRGMLRRASLSNRRLRKPSAATTAVISRKRISVMTRMVSMGIPKSEFMGTSVDSRKSEVGSR